MKTMHTKGVWEITRTSQNLETDIKCGGKRICEVKHFKGMKCDPTYKEGMANAKLIVVAPKMLAFIMEYYKFLNKEDQAKAVELIKEATGVETIKK